MQIFLLLSLLAFSDAKNIDQKIDRSLVSCEVCNRMVEGLYTVSQEKRKKAPKQKLDEGSVQEIVSSICKNGKPEGEWIRKLDITQKKSEKGTFLELIQPGGISKCNEECKVISQACEELLDERIDPDDLAVLIWKNKLSLKDAKVRGEQLCGC
jgi:hypothetical protein